MNLVLDEVARQLEREFVLIWVDGGPPDVFVLTSPERVVTVWSTRHLELRYHLKLWIGLLDESAAYLPA
jgi:hypothetical protein